MNQRKNRDVSIRAFRNAALSVAIVVAAATATALGNGKAYILVGNEDNADEVAANGKAADSAQNNYTSAGYTICRINNMTRQSVINAFQDPNTRAIWFVGHGGKTNAGYVPYWAYDTKDGAQDQGVSPSDIPGGPFNHVRQVVAHGCGQSLPQWAELVPDADYWSWEGSVTAWQIRFDEYWRGAGRIPPKEGAAPGSAGGGLAVDPRLDAAMPFKYFPIDDVLIDVPRNDYTIMPWRMARCIATPFEGLRFNVVVDDEVAVPQLLGGLEVASGRAVEQAESGYAEPDFVYKVHPAAWGDAIADIDSLRAAWEGGAAVIADDTTGIDPETLFLGASAVIWGLEAVWYEDFDEFSTGPLDEQSSWRAFDYDPDRAGFEVSNDRSRSPDRSLEIDGADDAVHQFFGLTEGTWVFSTWVYVPQAMDDQQWFILLNRYPTEFPNGWSLALRLDGAQDVVFDLGTGETLPLIKSEWAEIRVEIDLDQDLQSVFYNDEHLVTKIWSEGLGGKGDLNIAAVNPWGAGSAHKVYYDDMALTAAEDLCPADLDGDGDVGFADLLLLLAAWGNPGGPEDLDGSGVVGFGDLLLLLASWGGCPCPEI